MKKIFIVIICLFLLTSCSHSTKSEFGKVNEINDEIIEYNGNFYEYCSNAVTRDESDSFVPFLSNYSSTREPVSLNDAYIIDSRDINRNFVYFDSGILGSLVYKKVGFTAPDLSEVFIQPDKINEIIIFYNYNDTEIRITKNDEKEQFLDFLEKCYNEQKNEFSLKSSNSDFTISGTSSYYGGVFYFDIGIYENNGDYFLYSENIEMPEEINDIFKNNKNSTPE